MTSKPSTPRAAGGLGRAGRALWRRIASEVAPGWKLDERDLELLAQAARTADAIASLEAVVKREGVMSTGSTGQRVVHPAVAELRQARALLARLLAPIELEDPAVARSRMTPSARRAQDAALARGSGSSYLRGVGG